MSNGDFLLSDSWRLGGLRCSPVTEADTEPVEVLEVTGRFESPNTRLQSTCRRPDTAAQAIDKNRRGW
jgi:hypothetical protein